jgi:hypothetical protein
MPHYNSFFFLLTALQNMLLKCFLGGMDACDKVTELMKCGRENAPELLTAVMANLENSIQVIAKAGVIFDDLKLSCRNHPWSRLPLKVFVLIMSALLRFSL